MADWRRIPDRPNFEVNAQGRVRRAPILAKEDPSFNPAFLAQKVRIQEHEPEEEEDEDDDKGAQEAPLADPTPQAPAGWLKGQLLNVRNAGTHYNVTLFPEEYDPRYPERCLQFANSTLCQQFVSRWYMRENIDPRAR